jgi:hypothetical protein
MMDRPTDRAGAPERRDHGRAMRGMAAAPLLLVLLTGSVLASCSAAHPTGSEASSMPTMTASEHASMQEAADLPPADAAVAWAARPEYVSTTADTEAAYAYALYHPEVVRWMPCYCGCVAMNHRSNLDCYFKPAVAGVATTYEEHASYCDICVKTTLLAKRMTADGASLSEIRQAVDQAFGGGAPGTNTAYPPA